MRVLYFNNYIKPRPRARAERDRLLYDVILFQHNSITKRDTHIYYTIVGFYKRSDLCPNRGIKISRLVQVDLA